MKNFQIVLMVVFIAAAILGMLVFSGAIPLGDNVEGGAGTVVLWGTFRTNLINPLLEEFNSLHPTYTVSYVEKSAQSFNQELLEALASGVGPDLFFLPDNLAFYYRNKILVLPYQTYSLSAFRNNFATAGEVFLMPNGVLALPVLIDPLVMYYNRNMLDTNGITYPPKTWSELIQMTPTLTKKDENNKITKSAAALGHYTNVMHAKDILSALFMQAGNKIVTMSGERFVSDLAVQFQTASLPDILGFYTSFADPVKNVYSWNRSFPPSRDFFSTDNLGFYFGYASELPTLVSRNPNQNFGVTEIPQIQGSNFKTTFGRTTGLAISLFSRNSGTAFTAANDMANSDFAYKLSRTLGVVPARRDLLRLAPSDAYSSVFFASGLYARSWPDPSLQATDTIFQGMIDSVLSNSMVPSDAVADAYAKLNLLLSQ